MNTIDPFDTALYYDARDNAETLQHEDVDGALQDFVESTDDWRSRCPVTVKAYVREKLDTDYARLAKFVMGECLRRIDEDNEELCDPDGNHDMFAREVVSEYTAKLEVLLREMGAKAQPWACREVGSREFSVGQIETMLPVSVLEATE